MPRGEALLKYWRRLFHAHVHRAFDRLLAERRLTAGDRGDQVEVAAGDVVGGIAEHGLGGRVPGGDAVIRGHGQHRVPRRLGDDGQPPDRLLGAFLLRDVRGDGRGPHDGTTGSPHR